MKLSRYVIALAFVAMQLLASCVGQPPQLIITPTEPVGEKFRDEVEPLEVWAIVDSEEARLPAWVRRFYGVEAGEVEDLPEFAGRYVFISRNRGGSFDALRQWADNFCVGRDFARLVVARSERRFVARSLLYPEDEFGDFFVAAIRALSNGEYVDIMKEDTFWVKRELIANGDERVDFLGAPLATERFEFLVLISVDRLRLQEQVLELLSGVRPSVRPTREQALAIDTLTQTFFEGF